MRWEALFADLEAQADALAVADLDAEVAERVRIETGALALADRLRAHAGHVLTVRLTTAETVRGRVLDVVGDACLLGEESGGRVLLPLAGVVSVSPLGRPARTEDSPVLRRLGLRHALRTLARERARVRLSTAACEVRGTVDRVGADHVDVSERAPGEPAAPPVTVALAAILAVRPG